MSAAAIPTLRGDAAVGLLTDGYAYGARRFERTGRDAFHTRMLGRPATFVRGVDGARFFAEDERFTRVGALPPPVLLSLQDAGSVQQLTGPAHHARKALFLGPLDEAGRARLRAAFREDWEAALPTWRVTERVTLHRAVAGVLTRAVCRWAGIPLDARSARARTSEFLAMLDGAGGFGPRNWWGLLRRHQTETWARDVIRRGRAGEAGDVVARLLAHRDADGTPLSDDVAAVELINLLRPTVAVGRFIVFAALALHHHPEWAARFAAGDDEHLRGFVQEVRRTAPFFPLVAGRARHGLEWHGGRLAAGHLVALDIFATLRDPAVWSDPMRFRPERHAAAGERAPRRGRAHRAGRGRPRHRPPLPRRAAHDRAPRGRRAAAHPRHDVRRAAAGRARGPAALPDPATIRVRDDPRPARLTDREGTACAH